MKNYNKNLLLFFAGLVLAFLLLALFSSIWGSPIRPADAAAPVFTKTLWIRDDNIVSSKCTWDYGTYKLHYNMGQGVCFEDKTTIGDTGYQFSDGSRPYEYLEFVGVKNGKRSLSEWHYKRVATRRMVYKEKMAILKTERVEREIQKMESDLEKFLAAYDKKIQAMKDRITERLLKI